MYYVQTEYCQILSFADSKKWHGVLGYSLEQYVLVKVPEIICSQRNVKPSSVSCRGWQSHLFHLIAILRESHICPYSVTVVGIPRSKHVPLCPLARRPKWGAAGARRSWPIWLAELLSQQELLHATCCTSQRPFVINVPFRRSGVTLKWCFTVVEKTAGGVEGQLFDAKHNL